MADKQFSIASTLEKMKSPDKDLRFMATNDLLNELGKESFKLDADSEKKLTTQLLKLVEDKSSQVQELASKCLGPLAKRLKDAQVQEIIDTLGAHLVNTKKGAEELRDISGIAMKSVLTEIPIENQSLSAVITSRLTNRLISGITDNKEKHEEVVGDCLEILGDLLSKYGSAMVADHQKVLKVVQPELDSKRANSRKRSIQCLGILAVTIPDDLFNELVKNLVKRIQNPAEKSEVLRTYLQAIVAISRSVGFRLGKFLGDIVPAVVRYCEDSKFEKDDDLREHAFQCFESLVLRCPKEVTPYLAKMVDLAIKFIKYDPNYSEEDDVEDMEVDEEEEDEEEEEEGNYSDDDDMSWKVRRSCSRVLSAITTTRTDLLLSVVYQQIAPVLIGRFKEREENVRLDIYSTFVDVVKQTGFVSRKTPDLTATLTAPLRQLIPKIISAIGKQLKSKSTSVKTRIGAIGLVREIVVVLDGGLSDSVGVLIPGIVFSLGAKQSNVNLKIDALVLLRTLLNTHKPTDFHPFVKELVPLINKAVSDSYFRTSAEGLKAQAALIKLLRYDNSQFAYKPFVKDLFSSCLVKLKVQDTDQEVKESAINSMALIVARFADEIQPELAGVLSILQDRLTNEITRLTTVRALETIGLSKLKADLSPILAESLKELAGFLRKSNRQLKQSSVSTLRVLVQNYGAHPKAQSLYPVILTEVSPLISDADLHLSHLSLSLCADILKLNPASAASISNDIFPKANQLLRSPLLQGLALDSLLDLLSVMVSANPKGLDSLMNSLLELAKNEKNRVVLGNVAKAIAALASSSDKRDSILTKFFKDVSSKEERSVHLALYSIGEIGRRVDLSSHGNLEQTILVAFDSGDEETRNAASFALGNVAVGNLQRFLPNIISHIKSSPKHKYLLLHSLRECIVRKSSTPSGVDELKPFEQSIVPMLFEYCESEEEGSRTVVAECLGKLAINNPSIVSVLADKIGSSSPNVRGTVVNALKFAITDKPQPVDSVLLSSMGKFLSLLGDKDVNVRRNTLLALNYAAHNKPSLIRDVLPDHLAAVYGETKIRNELIRIVDLGPFKHKVDDGLETRKAAFEALYTLLDTVPDRLNLSGFVGVLVDGLQDEHDIRLLTHLILIRLASVAGPSLVEGLDQLVEPLKNTVLSKPKEGAVKQDIEKNDELIRSCLRAVAYIARIPNAESNLKFAEFMKNSVRTGEVADKWNAIKAETEKSDDMDLS